MSERAPVRPLDVRRAFRDIWRLYRDHWRLLTFLAVVVLVPQSLLDAAFGDIRIERVNSLADVAKLLSIPLALVINLGGEAFYSGIVAAVTLHWRAGIARPHVGEVAARIPYLTLIAIDLIVALGTAVGLLFLVVPGFAFATYTFISPALVEVRGLGLRAALREGYELVRGNFRRVLVIGVTVYVVTEAASELVALPFEGFKLEAAGHLLGEAVLQPFQGAAAVIVALALLEIHGREPVSVGTEPSPAGAG